jgi:hypothetical protein
MNKIVRILPGIFLSLLSLSSCDGLFTEDCIYKGYLHARNGFHHPSDMGTPEQAEMNLMVFPLTGNGVAEYDNLSIPFNGSGDAYGTLHIGSYEFLACNKDVTSWRMRAPPPPSACVFRRNRERSRRSRDTRIPLP